MGRGNAQERGGNSKQHEMRLKTLVLLLLDAGVGQDVTEGDTSRSFQSGCLLASASA